MKPVGIMRFSGGKYRGMVVDSRLRVVTVLPLNELWNDGGVVPAENEGLVGIDEIRALLRSGQVLFVRVRVGERLEWIEPAAAIEFWKRELSPHLAEPSDANSGVHLENWPEGYCYFAYQWSLTDGRQVIVAEQHH